MGVCAGTGARHAAKAVIHTVHAPHLPHAPHMPHLPHMPHIPQLHVPQVHFSPRTGGGEGGGGGGEGEGGEGAATPADVAKGASEGLVIAGGVADLAGAALVAAGDTDAEEDSTPRTESRRNALQREDIRANTGVATAGQIAHQASSSTNRHELLLALPLALYRYPRRNGPKAVPSAKL